MLRQGFSPIQSPVKQTPVLFGAASGGVGMQPSGSLLGTATAALNGVAPYHYWDFTTNRALFAQRDVGAVTNTPNWSFTRASTGYANQTPDVNFGTSNFCLRSETLNDGASWTTVRASVSANTTTAPNAALTADKLVEDTAPSDTHVLQQFVVLPYVSQITFSVYAKAAERSQVMLFVPAAAFGDATARSAYFDLATGTTSGLTGTGTTASMTAVGNGWYRCVLSTSATSSPSINFQFRLALGGSQAYSGDGTSGLFLWGAQIELGSTVSAYKPTTTTAVTATQNPPLVSFGANVPRLTNKGFLIEDARTNILLQSQTLDDATWVKVGATVNANAHTAPDATLTMDGVQASAGLTDHFVRQNLTWTAAVHTLSAYVRYVNTQWVALQMFDGTTNCVAVFDVLNGAVGNVSNVTSAIENLGNGVYKISITTNAALLAAAGFVSLAINNSNTASIVTWNAAGTEIVGVWGAQVEASTAHSSYIPTTTASVTRAADVATITSPSVTYPLTIYSQFNRPIAVFPTNTVSLTVSNGTQNERIANIVLATTSETNPVVVAGGVTQYGANVPPALAANVTTKMATRAGASSGNSARDNVLGTASGAISVPATPTVIGLGINAAATGQLNGYLLRAAMFNTALVDTTLQRVTA